MSTYMNHELLLFFCSVGTGAGLLFLYDWLRIIRCLFGCGKTLVSMSDFSFWIAGGVCIFGMMYRMNDGTIRSYAIMGIGAGMIAYRGIIGEKFTNVVIALGKIPVLFVKKTIKRLIFTAKQGKIAICGSLCRILSPVGAFLRIIWKKRTKKIGKKPVKSQSKKE